ncbi:DEAD/DEAH box helicase [Cryobacterium melibiosiphilum]|uniref:DEAD/DEAH box helicase n=1 Tax=Cryobacterium melibiosiphilum TaxID=995039 RepID=A0A3A5MH36_9MICO|nr:DEAD/DEAH box helicase family protein [Cryobacterium melibiosiphilum]RJT87249.1 DEAD/DEAH box helicase [Cryobacterium melibiosiphilum]
MSNFDFIKTAWPEIGNEAHRAEHYTFGDPRSSVFYARRALELTVQWMYRADSTLTRPYKDDLAALLFEPTFTTLVGPAIQAKMNLIRKLGNNAVHKPAPVRGTDSLPVVRELFQVMIWLATTYAAKAELRPAPGLLFDNSAVPHPQPGAAAQTQAQLQKLATENTAKDVALAQLAADNSGLRAQVAALQEQIAAAKAVSAVIVDTHDYLEDETRHWLIDVLLEEAGWPLADKRDREFAVTGMPNASGTGFVDYVLWGDDGLPLGLVEAKRTSRNAQAGATQARLYADALEQQFGQRPIIFYTNGYEHFIWDDERYPQREVSGFYTRDQLVLLVQRRAARQALVSSAIDNTIVGRSYQVQAITKIAESFEANQRKALLVMATGSGKTRTVIALADLLMRANWAKRVLFLADRRALVNQATKAFKEFLPTVPAVNLLTEKDTNARVFVSTYGTIMGLISQDGDTPGRFGPGYFDLIVIDEAHRSVYQKYGEIFTYFDSLLVGLTATPKDEVDHNTYGLFNLEDGVPTDSYDLGQAIADGYLVPPVGRPIDLGFMARGIRYTDLSDSERDQWDLLEWDDGLVPTEVDAAAVNKWLFNTDTVDKVLEVLMTEGRRVAGGDRLGKTIVFAKNQEHARFIAARFDANYPEYKGTFAQVITYQSDYVETLIETFSKPEQTPHIAISVDMLDTGIDVPDVVNLVFFKPVYSKTKYWQMIGRGTRLRPDLYGPGADKADFMIFDVCGNLDFFNQDFPENATPVTPPLRQRLFAARVRLLGAIDRTQTTDATARALRESLAAGLLGIVTGMSRTNFLVRRHLRAVERFADPLVWLDPSPEDLEDAAEHLGDLPSAVHAHDTDEDAKRFDLLALRAQLGVVDPDPAYAAAFAAAKQRIQQVARGLGEQRNIPIVKQNLELIDAVASDLWWDGVTLNLLELARLRLRGLVYLVDKTSRAIVYTDFEDTLGEFAPLSPHIVTPGVDQARFRQKLFAFLREHEDQAVLFKLRMGRQLTALDLAELERILLQTGGFSVAEIADGVAEANGLGMFIRSVAGMDRSAAADALSAFVGDIPLTGNQLAFVNLIIEQLTQRGAVPTKLLYEAPFTDFAPQGPDGLFTDAQVTTLVRVLAGVTATAEVAAS